MCKSKFKPVMLAALALLVAAPVAGADPARIVSQNAEAKQEASALPMRWPDAGPAYSATESRPDAATIAGMRMQAAAEHYGVTTADYGVNTTDYSRPNFAKPSPALVAGLRMNAAAEHHGVSSTVNAAEKSLGVPVVSGAPGAAGALPRASAGHPGAPSVSDLRSPDASDAAHAARPPQSPAVGDLRSPDARDAAQPRVASFKEPIARPNTDGQPVLSAPDSAFPWAGLLVGLGLAAMAGMLALVVVRGSRTRPLGR